MNRFAQKVAIVTGAASGLGAAISRRLAREGAHVAMVDVNAPMLAETVASIEHDMPHTTLRPYQLDLSTDFELFDSTMERINGDFGQIDVLVNNAGVLVAGNMGQIDLESYDNMMAINVKAPLFLTQAALPYLSVTRGNIVNTSSASANSALPLILTAYGMGKAAVSRLTEMAAADGVKNTGVRVNAIAPGVVETGMTRDIYFSENAYNGSMLDAVKNISPVGGGHIHADEIAAVVAFLASDDAKHMTGQIIKIDGGRGVYPDEAFMTRVRKPRWLE